MFDIANQLLVHSAWERNYVTNNLWQLSNWNNMHLIMVQSSKILRDDKTYTRVDLFFWLYYVRKRNILLTKTNVNMN